MKKILKKKKKKKKNASLCVMFPFIVITTAL